MVKKRKRTVLSIKDKVDILKLTETTQIATAAVDDRNDRSWPWLSPYHTDDKTIVSVALFLPHNKTFANKWKPNGFEHMMGSNNAFEWVCLSARHCSHHGYERRDCVNWPCLSIIHLTEHFTYPNEFLAFAGHRDSDNQGSTVVTITEQDKIIITITRQEQNKNRRIFFY